jgi:hypothetical protein
MRRILAAAIIFTLVVAPMLFADELDTITVNYEVQAINELEIDATSVTLIIDTATAGSQPDDAVDSTTATYAITTNGTNKRITAALDSAMPTDTSLYLTLAAPTASGSSAGEQLLSTSTVTVVSAITEVAESGLAMTFRFTALVTAGIIPSASKTLTLTLTDT